MGVNDDKLEVLTRRLPLEGTGREKINYVAPRPKIRKKEEEEEETPLPPAPEIVTPAVRPIKRKKSKKKKPKI